MKFLMSMLLIFSSIVLFADEYDDCVADCISEGFTSEYCSDTGCGHLKPSDPQSELFMTLVDTKSYRSWIIPIPEPECEPSIEECH